MKKLILFFVLSLCGTTVFALSVKPQIQINIEDARIFLPIKGSTVTAGFAKISNPSAEEIKVGIQAAAPFKACEAHETLEKDGRMAMQKADFLLIPAKGSLELKPGSFHFMFFDPSQEIKENQTIKVTLTINGQAKDFDFKVVPRSTSGHQHH